jgi:hypothetical protein
LFRGFAAGGQDGGEFIQGRDAELGRTEAHVGAVTLVEHPVRQLAGEVWPFIRIDAGHVLATPVARYLKRPAK